MQKNRNSLTIEANLTINIKRYFVFKQPSPPLNDG